MLIRRTSGAGLEQRTVPYAVSKGGTRVVFPGLGIFTIRHQFGNCWSKAGVQTGGTSHGGFDGTHEYNVRAGGVLWIQDEACGGFE